MAGAFPWSQLIPLWGLSAQLSSRKPVWLLEIPSEVSRIPKQSGCDLFIPSPPLAPPQKSIWRSINHPRFLDGFDQLGWAKPFTTWIRPHHTWIPNTPLSSSVGHRSSPGECHGPNRKLPKATVGWSMQKPFGSLDLDLSSLYHKYHNMYIYI